MKLRGFIGVVPILGITLLLSVVAEGYLIKKYYNLSEQRAKTIVQLDANLTATVEELNKANDVIASLQAEIEGYKVADAEAKAKIKLLNTKLNKALRAKAVAIRKANINYRTLRRKIAYYNKLLKRKGTNVKIKDCNRHLTVIYSTIRGLRYKPLANNDKRQSSNTQDNKWDGIL